MYSLVRLLAVMGLFCPILSSCGDDTIATETHVPSNRDVPQHFTMTLEISFERSNEDDIAGRMQGYIVFDESLQTLARQTLESGEFGNDPTEINLLSEIARGKKEVDLAGFIIMGGGNATITDTDGYFVFPVRETITTLDVLYEDVTRGEEVRIRTFAIPELPGKNHISVPLEFDHRFPHGHALHDHGRDHGSVEHLEQGLAATMSVNDLRCRKCNGWWNWDGGRTGSDCFQALNAGFAPCWAEAMNLDRVMGGRYCNGTRNCSMYIGHGWNDNHTHGSSSWQCR